MSLRQVLVRGIGLGILATMIVAGILFGYVAWYAGTNRLFPGMVIGYTQVGGLPMPEAQSRLVGAAQPPPTPDSVLPAATGSFLPEAVDARPTLEEALAEAIRFGRQGGIWQRTHQFLIGLIHGHFLPLAQAEGVPADAPARQALAPAASNLAGAMQAVVARQILTVPEATGDRRKNLERAVGLVSGLLLPAGAEFSFQQQVGPLDEQHDWLVTKELFQGEFRLQRGGGTSHLASALYDAALLAGLTVTERHIGERPLAEVEPGRDGVVTDGGDLRFRNTLAEPLRIDAQLEDGDSAHLTVTLYASQGGEEGAVRLEEAERRYLPPEVVEVIDSTLPTGSRAVIREGRYGVEVRIYRVWRDGETERRELISQDRYQSRPSQVRVGP